jgi:hypothetical protein
MVKLPTKGVKASSNGVVDRAFNFYMEKLVVLKVV